MSRVRSVALLALGCALAAASAATGPLLAKDGSRPPFLVRLRATEQFRRARVAETPGSRFGHLADVIAQVVIGIALVAIVLYGLYRVVRALVRLVLLLMARSAGARDTTEYDPGEGTGDDVDTVLRRRVAEELTALSADLDTAAEPREVVIACYARMEAALAAAGSPRRATESPLELLTRVLGEHDVPEGDVRRLTELFTRARFSPHPVTDDMRASARRSLAAIAGALEGVPA